LLILMLSAPGCCSSEALDKSCASPEHYGVRHTACCPHCHSYGIVNPGCYGYQPTCWHAWPYACGPSVCPPGLPAGVSNDSSRSPNGESVSVADRRQASEIHVALRSDGASKPQVAPEPDAAPEPSAAPEPDVAAESSVASEIVPESDVAADFDAIVESPQLAFRAGQ
jgi:hypothetical protein